MTLELPRKSPVLVEDDDKMQFCLGTGCGAPHTKKIIVKNRKKYRVIKRKIHWIKTGYCSTEGKSFFRLSENEVLLNSSHLWCRGIYATPNRSKVVTCECECHAGYWKWKTLKIEPPPKPKKIVRRKKKKLPSQRVQKKKIIVVRKPGRKIGKKIKNKSRAGKSND